MSSVVSSQRAALPTQKPWRPSPLSKVFAFTPLWVLIITTFTSPTFFGAITAESPLVFGLPPGALVDGLAMFWMLIGVYVLWNARSPVIVSLAYALFTIPATVAVVLAPAIVLILQNVG